MSLVRSTIKLLLFSSTRDEMLQFDRKLFLLGLAGTWLVGMGRYWDDEQANIFQHLGLGSVFYIFILSAFIWLTVKPFHVEGWNYFRILTFVGLTSFPAIFYAIPVERYYSVETANKINVGF